MNNKGFTLLEILITFIIIIILFGLGIPAYLLVSNQIKEHQYENKKSLVLMKAENWAANTGRNVTNVEHLITEGYLDADDEFGDYRNPVDDSSMLCDTIRIDFDQSQYHAYFTDEKFCDYQELEEQSTIIHIVQKDSDGHIMEEDSWTRNDTLLEVQFIEEADYQKYYSYVQKIEWRGNNQNETIKIENDFDSHNSLMIRASQFMNVRYEVTVTIVYEGKTYIYKAYQQVKIDNQKPTIYQDDLSVSQSDHWQADAKTVHLVSTDYNGSGVYGYYYASSNDMCSNDLSDYTPTSSSVFDLQLKQGDYNICVIDQVGNVSDSVSFQVYKIDSTKPTLSDFEMVSSSRGVEYYRELTLKIKVQDDLSGANAVKYCFTTSHCTPDLMKKVDSSNFATISFEDSYQLAQKLCVIGIDQAGNESGMKCSDSYFFDQTKPDISEFSSSLVNHSYQVSFGADDKESGIAEYQVYLGTADNNYHLEKDLITSNLKGSYSFSKLKANTDYLVKLVVVNKAGISSEKVISMKTNYTMTDAIRDCNVSGSYCSNGVYVKYGENVFVLYRVSTNSIFGVNLSNNMRTSIINDFCCDQGTCKEENVYSTSWSGIYSEGGDNTLKTYYNQLPDPSKYLNLETYSFGVSTGIPSGTYIKKKTMQARFGLLDLGEYQQIYKKSYMKDVGTLLSTVYTVCLSTDHYECDNEVDNITGIYALNGVLATQSAVTGKHHDINVNAAMTVPFKNTLVFTGGSGTKDDPYTIE